MLKIDSHGFISSKSDARAKNVIAQETYNIASDGINAIRERELARQEREGIIIKGRWATGLPEHEAHLLSVLQDVQANMIELGAKPRNRSTEAA